MIRASAKKGKGEAHMLRKIHGQNKKYFAVLAVIFVLICSFSDLESDTPRFYANGNPLSQSTLVSQVLDFEEILCTPETAVSSSPAAFLRQLSSRKHSTGSFTMNAYVLCIPPLPAIVVLFFMRLQRRSDCSTHRFIIRYIDNKDGKKA